MPFKRQFTEEEAEQKRNEYPELARLCDSMIGTYSGPSNKGGLVCDVDGQPFIEVNGVSGNYDVTVFTERKDVKMENVDGIIGDSTGMDIVRDGKVETRIE